MYVCCFSGKHVALYSPGGPSGNSGDSYGSCHLSTDGGNWHIQPCRWPDLGNQVKVELTAAQWWCDVNKLTYSFFSRRSVMACLYVNCARLLCGSDAKIPLWRWQQMMVFMLANTIACIVTSVVLNIVDHRQVRPDSLSFCLPPPFPVSLPRYVSVL